MFIRIKCGILWCGAKNNLDCELIDSCSAEGCQTYFVASLFCGRKKCSEAGSPGTHAVS